MVDINKQPTNIKTILSQYAASVAAPYPLGFIHLDLDGRTLDVEREAPK